jgi:hypothetical protein
MTSGATTRSSKSRTPNDLEVDAEGRACCPDCGQFAIETMVNPITQGRIKRGPLCEANANRKMTPRDNPKLTPLLV